MSPPQLWAAWLAHSSCNRLSHQVFSKWFERCAPCANVDWCAGRFFPCITCTCCGRFPRGGASQTASPPLRLAASITRSPVAPYLSLMPPSWQCPQCWCQNSRWDGVDASSGDGDGFDDPPERLITIISTFAPMRRTMINAKNTLFVQTRRLIVFKVPGLSKWCALSTESLASIACLSGPYRVEDRCAISRALHDVRILGVIRFFLY